MKENFAYLEVKNMQDVFYEQRPEYEDYEEDQRIIRVLDKDNKYPLNARYSKYCIDIIRNSLISGDDRIMLLSRTKTILGKYSLEEVQKKLQLYFKGLGYSESDIQKIAVKTMHTSKGDEADTVIILEANKTKLPIIHPDNELYEVFGVKEDDIIKDEKRLFYVAITRAKKKLYITYNDEESDFVKSYMEGINRAKAVQTSIF